MLQYSHTDRSNIGPNDCLQISQRDLSNLSELYLSNNHIGSEGCSYIAKAHCPKLKIIALSNLLLIHPGTILAVKDANILNMRNGPYSTILSFVENIRY